MRVSILQYDLRHGGLVALVESLGNAVTVDGPRGLDTKYMTHCDPRLNSAQALEIAFMVAERLRGQAGLPAMLD